MPLFYRLPAHLKELLDFFHLGHHRWHGVKHPGGLSRPGRRPVPLEEERVSVLQEPRVSAVKGLQFGWVQSFPITDATERSQHLNLLLLAFVL
jgi:hypothetical protein